MKKIISYLSMCSILFALGSCTDIDNYDLPKETFKGKFIDSTTGDAFLCEQGTIHLRLEELSWSDTPSPQSIPSKQDGSFNDSRLFGGHYRISPYEGPFWPVEPIEIDIKGVTERDFTLTPYLKITNVDFQVSGTTLTYSCKINAPLAQNNGQALPQILDLRAFINITPLVGNGANIADFSNQSAITIEQNWSDEIAATVYSGQITNLLPGRTFYIRMGARVNDTFRRYNYSEIVEIKIP